ncbi:MAG TPA: carboxypeptidase M32 [Gammaproteobacteria bacterium]|nr:carboxypeptidase M32 [Gammaproteobacteria bacterium]
MLSPAEQLGLAGAVLDARVRQAVNYIPDSTLVHVAKRLADDARANEVLYAHEGVLETVRIMLRPLLVMPEQLSYLHNVCSRIMSALARFPDLYARDPDMRRVLPLADDERAWFEEVWHPLHHAAQTLYGRLDALCDFTSARWQDSLRFMEPNLSGVGGLHFGPLAESLVMRDVVPTLTGYDPNLAIELPRDQRDLFLQVLLDHARAVGRAGSNLCLVEPKYVAEGPEEQSHLVEYFRARRGIELTHADPRELRLVGDEVYYEDVRVDVAYRDYELRDLLALETEHGTKLDAIRALFRQNRMVSSIGGDLDHKSCWEVLTTEALSSRYFSIAERQMFRRHILWTRILNDRSTDTPDGVQDLPRYAREHREELVLKPNRGYGGAGVHLGAGVSQGEWERLLDTALAEQHDPHRQWVVQAAAALPVHLFPVLDERGRTHEEPFYAVMGFASTDHGLGIIARVSQKQVVNVAQRGGLAAVLVGHPPADLTGATRSPVQGERARQELRAAVTRLRDLDAVIRLLEWDEETYRPAGAAEKRASQLAVLEGVRHELLAGDRLGDLLATVSALADLPAEDRAELRLLGRVRRAAVALPESLVTAFAQTRSHCLAAWEEARSEDDFARFAGPFDALLKLMRERAEALKLSDDLYDSLLDEHEPGMRRARLDPLLQSLGTRLGALVPLLAERTRRFAALLPRAHFDEHRQREFCATLLADIGFDFARGRLDRSSHPFTLMAGEDDVRLTFRSRADDPVRSIFATLHEGGHALYDQGYPRDLHGRLLADAPSTGVHEAQARLWENHVGRSGAFWQRYFATLRELFPAALAGSDARSLHRAINVVAPGLNRVAADEATYNLHILLRYELENALLGGDLAVADLPGAWNERQRHHLGVVAPTARDGCLQDVHWALGEFGYFPTYTLGNLYAAQLVETYARTHDLDAEIARGDFLSLREWLRANVHAYGATLDAETLMRQATGQGLDVEPFFRRLEQRVAALE